MKRDVFTVAGNTRVAAGTFELILSGDTSGIRRPGQFAELALPGFFLRRPFSVCDWNARGLTVIYKSVGTGTAYLSALAAGAKLDALTGLGNGFDPQKSGERPLLIGGGTGASPLYGLCERLVAEGKHPAAILGFGTGNEVFYADRFAALGAETVVATADGSAGVRGFVTDAMERIDGYSCFYACGPEAMLRAVCAAAASDGEVSLEARMGCGFGACMGCSVETVNGPRRVCRDGPVFKKGEILW